VGSNSRHPSARSVSATTGGALSSLKMRVILNYSNTGFWINLSKFKSKNEFKV
jgi:hypothetical protein